MKKVNLFGKLIIAVSLILITAGVGMIGLVIYNGINGYHALDLPDKNVSFRIKDEGINIRSEGAVRSRAADKVFKALDDLGNISKEQARYGIIMISEKTIPQGSNPENIYSGDPDDYRTAGFYSIDKKMIVVNDAKNADWTLFHEMGHFVDHNHLADMRITDMKEWQKVLESEYSLTKWDLYYSNPQEYFAESFAAYYSTPEWLQERCPMTYSFIDSVVREYNG